MICIQNVHLTTAINNQGNIQQQSMNQSINSNIQPLQFTLRTTQSILLLLGTIIIIITAIVLKT